MDAACGCWGSRFGGRKRVCWERHADDHIQLGCRTPLPGLRIPTGALSSSSEGRAHGGVRLLVLGRGWESRGDAAFPPVLSQDPVEASAKRQCTGSAPGPWLASRVSPANCSASVTSFSLRPATGAPQDFTSDSLCLPFLTLTCISLSKNPQPSRKLRVSRSPQGSIKWPEGFFHP